MIVGAGMLIGISLTWVMGAFYFKLVQNIPLGPVNLKAKGEEYRESERRVIESQRRFARFWRRRLWPVAVVSFIGAVILLAIANP